jgi:hypothetical protein
MTYTIKNYNKHIEGISELIGSIEATKRMCKRADEFLFCCQIEALMVVLRDEFKSLPPAGQYIKVEGGAA